jgi:cytochrome oxidase Cu insertion factor (SCO1/SenC/PrrC family)
VHRSEGMQKLALAALVATSALVVIVGAFWATRLFVMSRSQQAIQSTNQANYPLGGFPMAGNLAPDFTLSDQFGRSVTLSSLRGHEVVLAFIDARCKTLCPLTSTIMYNAKAQLALSASRQVQLVAVNANSTATSIAAVQAWSINHGMLHQWEFLTGSAQQLQSIYSKYNVFVQVDSNGVLEHDPIIFIIDSQGHERLYFETLDSNSQSDLKSQEIGLEAGMRQWLPTSH